MLMTLLIFFEALADTTMFALSPPDHSQVNQDKSIHGSIT